MESSVAMKYIDVNDVPSNDYKIHWITEWKNRNLAEDADCDADTDFVSAILHGSSLCGQQDGLNG